MSLQNKHFVKRLDEELVSAFRVEDLTFEVNLPQTSSSCALLLLLTPGN